MKYEENWAKTDKCNILLHKALHMVWAIPVDTDDPDSLYNRSRSRLEKAIQKSMTATRELRDEINAQYDAQVALIPK